MFVFLGVDSRHRPLRGFQTPANVLNYFPPVIKALSLVQSVRSRRWIVVEASPSQLAGDVSASSATERKTHLEVIVFVQLTHVHFFCHWSLFPLHRPKGRKITLGILWLFL